MTTNAPAVSDAFYFVFATAEEAYAALPSFASGQGEALRAQARAAAAAERESFERCDTDGFVSQWCHTITHDESQREAALADAGNLVVGEALMSIATGQIVSACVRIEPDRFRGYGDRMVWRLTGHDKRFVGYAKRDSTYTKHGLRRVFVLAPGRMYAQAPGDARPEPRGLSGLASYSGKRAAIDYVAAGLPL